MHYYYAVSGSIAYMGSFTQCQHWAENRIAAKKAKIVKICKARCHQKRAKIVWEVTKDGVRDTPYGRCIDLALLKKAAKDGQETTT